MSSSRNTSDTQYYLGIAGEQVGPFSESDVLQKIHTGAVTKETLVWYDGMGDWAPLTGLAVFENAFQRQERVEPASPSLEERQVKKAPQKRFDFEKDEEKEEEYSPVFQAKDSRFGDSPFVKIRVISITVGLISMAALAGAYFYINSIITDKAQRTVASRNKVPKDSNKRQERLGKAVSELLINPQTSIPELENLIKENESDHVGKEAFQTLLEHYRRDQKPEKLGAVYLLAKRYFEAGMALKENPDSKSAAEVAFYEAYKSSVDPEVKKKALMEDISLLVGPLSKVDVAVERIKIFEKEFPSEKTVYRYYLQTTEEKIASLFPKVSFYFVQGLLSSFESELSQITLIDRPLVEVKKTPSNQYRVVGSYKGEVLLNKERLNDIHFIFWLTGDRWALVDTNITKERKAWALQSRAKAEKVTFTPDAMLRQLEDIFRNQFPQNAIHEDVTGKSSRQTASPKEDSFR